MNFKIVLCKTADVAKSLNPHVAIEAEWGSNYCEGSIVTLNHHCEAFKLCQPPCVTTLTEDQHKQLATLTGIIVIVISHFDLDTLGGILEVLNLKVLPKEFWEFAGQIDLQGVHNVDYQHSYVVDYLHAFWAWSEKNRLQLPKDQTSLNASEFINSAITTIQKIANQNVEIFEAGRQWFENMKTLEVTSFKSTMVSNLNVIIRESGHAGIAGSPHNVDSNLDIAITLLQ